MSLESWKKEFYPIRASDIAKIVEDRGPDISTESKIELIEHSLRKWEGNKSKNLTKHKMENWSNSISDERGDYLEVDSSSCSLCKVFYKKAVGGDACGECPLSIVRGGFACDEDDDSGGSPWHRARTSDGNPQNMIHWLKKSKDMLEGKYIPKKKKD